MRICRVKLIFDLWCCKQRCTPSRGTWKSMSLGGSCLFSLLHSTILFFLFRFSSFEYKATIRAGLGVTLRVVRKKLNWIEMKWIESWKFEIELNFFKNFLKFWNWKVFLNHLYGFFWICDVSIKTLHSKFNVWTNSHKLSKNWIWKVFWSRSFVWFLQNLYCSQFFSISLLNLFNKFKKKAIFERFSFI